MITEKKILLYDLDGTLVDSMPGIALSFRHTLKELNVPEPSDEKIRAAIGPGLHKALEVILGSDDAVLIDKAVKIYREHHDSIGYKATTLFPEVREMIQEINNLGVPQFVVSMKSDTIVRPILSYLDMLVQFVDAIGASPEGKTRTKAEMLRFLADKYNFSLSNAVLVGDTSHDASAAKLAGVRFFGVTFGYGTKAELDSVQWGEQYDSVANLRLGLLKEFKGN